MKKCNKRWLLICLLFILVIIVATFIIATLINRNTIEEISTHTDVPVNNSVNEEASTEEKVIIESTYKSSTSIPEEISVEYNKFLEDYYNYSGATFVNEEVRTYDNTDFYVCTTFSDGCYSEFRYMVDGPCGAQVYCNNELCWSWP